MTGGSSFEDEKILPLLNTKGRKTSAFERLGSKLKSRTRKPESSFFLPTVMSSQARKPRSTGQAVKFVPTPRKSNKAMKYAVWATILAVLVAVYSIADSIKVSFRLSTFLILLLPFLHAYRELQADL